MSSSLVEIEDKKNTVASPCLGRNLLCIRLEWVLVWWSPSTMVHWGPSQKNSERPRRCLRESESCLSDQPGTCPCPLTLSPLARVSHHDLYFSRLAYEVLLLIVWECTSAYFSKVIVFGCRVPQLPWFCREIHRTPQATTFTAVVSYGERYTAQSQERKDSGKVQGQTRDELQQSSSRGATQDGLHSRNVRTATPWPLSTGEFTGLKALESWGLVT